MSKTPKVQKSDNLTPEHLEWLVESRNINQRSALKLFTLIDSYPTEHQEDFLSKIQLLVAITFSLWRAAFLADRTGNSEAVLEDAKAFLGKILTDNAITYPQDRATREWTFNYYMSSARACLRSLKSWKPLEMELASQKPLYGKNVARLRWQRTQKALDIAIACFERDLKTTS